MSPLFTDITFSDEAWLEYLDWQATDKRITRKINDLIKDIKRNGVLHGTGKPEQLKHFNVPTFSRRIDEANRLVYCTDEDSKSLKICACKGHYGNVLIHDA